MESFFGLLQNNVLDRQQWSTREELRIAIVTLAVDRDQFEALTRLLATC